MTRTVRRPAKACNDVAAQQTVTPNFSVSDVLDAAYLTAHNYQGGVPALAQRMGMNHNTLQLKVSLDVQTHHLNLKESVLMQGISKDVSILHAMASALDHVALPMPANMTGDVRMQLARIGAEAGDVFREVEKALRDGKVTPNERRRIHTQVAEAIQALTAVIKEL